jgi:hypothetical protein
MMSKASRKKALKRRKHRDKLTWQFVCPQCQSVDDGSPGALLTNLADALNACADMGMAVRVRHGAVLAEGPDGGGYVLPLEDGRWTARTLTYDRFALPPPPGGLDD